MRNVTRQVLTGLAFAASLAAMAALAGARAASEGDPASTAAPACRKAEVNLVTGHVLGIDPIARRSKRPVPPSRLRTSPTRDPTRPGLGVRTASLKGPARVDEPTSRTFSEIRFPPPRFALFERDSILCHRLRAT